MTDRKLFRDVLRAFGAIREGLGSEALLNQEARLEEIILQLEVIKHNIGEQRRVMYASETRDQRLKPGDPSYWTHMSHCYGLDYDDVYGDGEPTARYTCKYGEDHLCPAALFEDPLAEYKRASKSGEIKR